MTKDHLFTHQLPRAADECKPFLLKQFPFLKEVNEEDITSDNWKEWVNKLGKKFGEFLDVHPLPRGVHIYKNPIAEAYEMMN